jgi:hypothetical protein
VYSKIEKRIAVLCKKRLSLGGRLTLVKYVLKAISIYLHGLAYIPIGHNKRARNDVSSFFGMQKRRNMFFHIAKPNPKDFGGWENKNI